MGAGEICVDVQYSRDINMPKVLNRFRPELLLLMIEFEDEMMKLEKILTYDFLEMHLPCRDLARELRQRFRTNASGTSWWMCLSKGSVASDSWPYSRCGGREQQ